MTTIDMEDSELFERIVEEYIVENGEDFVDVKAPKKRRVARSSRLIDFYKTKWGVLLTDPNTRVPNTYQGKLFRRRFRVPFQVFDEVLLPMSKEYNVFGNGHNSRIPIAIKLLAGLRILGRGSCCDDISECADIGESTANAIFHQFVEVFARKIFNLVVYAPQYGDAKLEEIVRTYTKLGLPGCVGSMDCTHIHWMKCPKENTIECTGKEQFPTLSFQCVVDHSRRILYCSNYFYGKNNDITVANNDEYTRSVRMGLYQDVQYELIDENGVVQRVQGGWVLVDGGFLKLGCFIDPMHERLYRDAVLWSEWMESARKDVECTFGIIKSRFRFLWNGVHYHSPDTIEYAFKTACILHNLILSYDGRSLEAWEDVDWETLDPNGIEPED